AELPELVPGAPEERPDAGETAVAVPVGVGAFGAFGVFGVFSCGGRALVRGFVDLVPGGDGVGRVEGGGGAGGGGGFAGGGVLRTAPVAVADARAAGGGDRDGGGTEEAPTHRTSTQLDSRHP